MQAETVIWISLEKKQFKIVKTISAHSKSTVWIFRTLKEIFISWHYPFKTCYISTSSSPHSYCWICHWWCKTEISRDYPRPLLGSVFFINIFLGRFFIFNLRRMRSSLVVRASDCQCTSCNGPGFDPSIRRHNGIWGAADETVLKIE